MRICNIAGEVVESGLLSDAEACRWFLDSGRYGDYLEDTGEDLADVTRDVLGISVLYDRNECVVKPPYVGLSALQAARTLATADREWD